VHTAPATNSASGESAAHEPDALSVRGILWFVIIFVLANALVLLIVWWMYVGFVDRSVEKDVVNSALAGEQRFPPEPRLQPSLGHQDLPQQDLAALHAREQEEFLRRGWIDKSSGKFEIPATVVAQVSQLPHSEGGAK
jgi:hypothetical protein